MELCQLLMGTLDQWFGRLLARRLSSSARRWWYKIIWSVDHGPLDSKPMPPGQILSTEFNRIDEGMATARKY
jgi:hypothetical protein